MFPAIFYAGSTQAGRAGIITAGTVHSEEWTTALNCIAMGIWSDPIDVQLRINHIGIVLHCAVLQCLCVTSALLCQRLCLAILPVESTSRTLNDIVSYGRSRIRSKYHKKKGRRRRRQRWWRMQSSHCHCLLTNVACKGVLNVVVVMLC